MKIRFTSQLVISALTILPLCTVAPTAAQKLPICCEDFTGPADGQPDRTVDVVDLLALLAQWGASPATHPSPDIAPFSTDGCPAGGDGIVDVGDLLALLTSWGPCDSAVDDCAGVLDPANTYARISADGVYPFRINGLLDGPRRGPHNDLCECVCFFTSCGWGFYGFNGIPGGYTYGDRFGIDMSTDPFTEGGDVWFHYTAPASGSAFFEVRSNCGPGALTDTLIDIYPADACPTGTWGCCGSPELLACDENSAPETCSGGLSRLRIDALQGESYLVRVGGWTAERGDGALEVTLIDNSVLEQALPLAIGESISGSTVGTQVPAAPDCAGVDVAAPGRWHTFVGDGRSVTAGTQCIETSSDWTTCHGDDWALFDHRLSVYTSTDGTAAGLTCIAAANDDICGLSEQITWMAEDGVRYYILVHGTPNVPAPFLSEGPYLLQLSNGP